MSTPRHDCKTDDRKRAIDRPCSACSDGDSEMEYHDHCPPFREGVAAPLEPSRLSAEDFYTKSDSAEPWNDTLSYTLSGKERDDAFLFAEAYAAAVSKNLQEERRPWIDVINRELGGLRELWNSAERKLKVAESRILELEKEITALRETK